MIEIIALLAFVLFAGFFGEKIFEKWRIPDILILLLVGLLLGPLGMTQALPGLGNLTPSLLMPLASLIAVITLVVILFGAGTEIEPTEFIKNAPFALTATVINFITTTIACFIALLLTGWYWQYALLIAIIVADTAEEIVFSITSKLKLKPWVKNLLVFEGAFTSTLIAVFTIIFASIFANEGSLREITSAFIGNISVSLFVGVIVSYAWVKILVANKIANHRYLLTLATAILLYALVEGLMANGVISVLIFGIALGMAKNKLEISIFDFHNEITFLVRSFFFVYLGFIISLGNLTTLTIISSLLVTLAMAGGRLIGLLYTVKAQAPTKAEFVLLAGALPSGLATAVFATVLESYGIKIPGLSEFIFLVIFESIMVSMVCSFYYASKTLEQPRKPVIVSSN